jgi:predicted metal-dependent peptidase
MNSTTKTIGGSGYSLNSSAASTKEPKKKQYSQEEIKQICESATRKITRCRIKLINKQAFFGNLITHLVPVLSTSLKFGTMATDGRHLFYDPFFVMEHTDEEIKWVICHEVMHCSLKHFIRRQGNPDYWNAAADYALNYLIMDLPAECGTPLPDGLGCSNDKTKTKDEKLYVKDVVAGWNAEAIYQYLLQNEIDLPPVEKWNFGGIEPPQKENNSGDKSEGEGSGGGSDGSDELITPADPLDPKELEKYWDDRLKEALNKSQGTLPGGFLRKILQISEPKIDWKQKLRNFITSVGKKSRWNIPDRRFLGDGTMDPQFKKDSKMSSFDQMVVICDTSGSMGDRELQAFAAETISIMGEFNVKKVLLIWCDSRVHLPVEEVNPKNMQKLLVGRGGGGTDFRPPFQWIEKNIKDMKKMGPVIYFTDAYGPFPDPTEYGISKYKDKVLWVITYNQGYGKPGQMNAPFGQQIDLPV